MARAVLPTKPIGASRVGLFAGIVDKALHHWGDVLLLTFDPATTTMPTLRLTQRYQTTTTSPLPPAVRLSLCSHQVSNCLVRSPCGGGCFRPAMALPHGHTWTTSFAAQCRPTIFTSRTSSTTLGFLGSWWMKSWRWRGTPFSAVSAQAPTALHRSNRRKCAFLLRDLCRYS